VETFSIMAGGFPVLVQLDAFSERIIVHINTASAQLSKPAVAAIRADVTAHTGKEWPLIAQLVDVQDLPLQ
jgi:hypothetical protein